MNGNVKQLTILAAIALSAAACATPGASDLTSVESSFTKSDNAPVSQASGGGTVDVPQGRSTYAFHASANGAGEVKGNFNAHFSNVDANVRGDVTCLAVVGNRATMAGVVTATSDATLVPVGRIYAWQVVDNGEGSNASPDQVSAFYPVGSNFCNYDLFTDKDWSNGNVQVK